MQISWKTLSSLLVFLWLGVGARAQTNPPAATNITRLPVQGALSTNREEELRRLLRQAMSNRPPSFPSFPGSPVPAAPAGATGAVKVPLPGLAPAPTATPATNVIGASTSAPPAIPAPAPAAQVPSPAARGATNVPAPTPATALPSPAATLPSPAAASPTAVAPVVPPAALPPAAVPALPSPPAVPAGLPIPGAPAQAPANFQPLADQDQIIAAGLISVQGMPLDQFFDLYSQLSGRTILRPYQLPGQGITLKAQTDLTKREAIEAMDGALALNSITMIPIGEKFVKAVPSTQAMQEGAPLSALTASEMPLAEQFITRVVKLKTAKPSELAPLFATFSKNPTAITPIDANQTIILRDYASNVKRMLEIIETVDVIPESDYKLEVIPIKYGKVTELYDTMNSLITGSGAPSSSARAPASQQSQLRSGVGTQPGQPGYGQQGQLGQPMQAGQPSVAASRGSFQQRLQQIVNRASSGGEIQLLGEARIVPDERSNSLIVFASKKDMEMITNIVAKVDVLLAQVLIEGIVLSVALDNTQDTGVSWLQNPKRFNDKLSGAGGINAGAPFLSSVTNFAGGLPSGFSYFGNIGNDFEVAIKAIATDGRARVLQRPRLQTSHAVPGSFFSGSTVPYVTGFSDYGGFSTIGTRSQVQQMSVGVDLQVTPFITPDGLVVLEIFQDISAVDKFVKIDQNDVPTTSSRRAQATLSVRDGDTIILGGYIEEKKNTAKEGVPLLKDIPLLGALFRSKSDKSSRAELILLMRVMILKTPDDAAIQASADKSPLVQEAEMDFKKDEQKRQKRLKATSKQ
ncbi:MAG: secretin N-terminal domain-containing protein [Verrucomicrobiota bacterium]